jgi:hypothetical protein
MKATTGFRRVVCVAAAALVLTTAAGCRGTQHVDDLGRAGGRYADEAGRAGQKADRRLPIPPLDKGKDAAEMACRANEQRTGRDSRYC